MSKRMESWNEYRYVFVVRNKSTPVAHRPTDYQLHQFKTIDIENKLNKHKLDNEHNIYIIRTMQIQY